MVLATRHGAAPPHVTVTGLPAPLPALYSLHIPRHHRQCTARFDVTARIAPTLRALTEEIHVR